MLLLTANTSLNLHNIFLHFEVQSYIEYLVEFKFKNVKVKINALHP